MIRNLNMLGIIFAKEEEERRGGEGRKTKRTKGKGEEGRGKERREGREKSKPSTALLFTSQLCSMDRLLFTEAMGKKHQKR